VGSYFLLLPPPLLVLPLPPPDLSPGPGPFSSRKAATHTSGAFQLIVISLADQASMLSMKHFWGAQPFRPAAWT
jgi:hypothetical protein